MGSRDSFRGGEQVHGEIKISRPAESGRAGEAPIKNFMKRISMRTPTAAGRHRRFCSSRGNYLRTIAVEIFWSKPDVQSGRLLRLFGLDF